MYLQYKDSKKLIYLIALSVISVIGFLFKATVIFALFAIVIDIFFNSKFKDFIKRLLIIACISIICLTIINKVIDHVLDISKEDYNRFKFPYTHHIMMALNTTGGYKEKDVQYTTSFPTYEEKKNANINVIKERISKRGIYGTARHLLYTKVVRTWTNNTFAVSDYLGRNPIKQSTFQDIFTMEGKLYRIFDIYTNVYWFVILLGIIIGSLYRKQSSEDIQMVSKYIILMLALFLIIWECNSRYVIQILPLIIMVGISGWEALCTNNPMKKCIEVVKNIKSKKLILTK